MRSKLNMAVCLIAFLATCDRASAQNTRDLSQGIASATTIIVGRLDQYIAEPESMDRMVEQQARSSGVLTGNPSAIVMMTIQQRGTYVFHVTSTIKGASPQPLILRLPRVSGSNGLFTDSTQRIPLKATYMLLLSGDPTVGYSPAAPAPMAVSKSVKFPDEPIDSKNPEKVRAEVMRILIESLNDPATRSGAASLLSGSTGEDVIRALRPLADDPDDGLRESAILCLATNQDVTVIPKIAAWKYNRPNASGNPLVTALSRFKTPAAIPYLNQLLLDTSSQYVPLNAAMALRQLPPDKSSIPFWFKALRQPGMTPFHAYYVLHTVIPDLGPPGDMRTFGQNREAEIKKLEDWWADEQAGKLPPAMTLQETKAVKALLANKSYS